MSGRTSTDLPESERWNHNIHLHPVILDAVPVGAERALDAGCGEGMLTRKLARRVPEVIGIDRHQPSIEQARAVGTPDDATGSVDYVLGDLMAHDFEPQSFDLIGSVATLHHLGTRVGLERFRDLLAPGGVLAIVGHGRLRLPHDIPWELAGSVATRWLKLSRTYWEHPSPIVWPPPDTHAEVRRIAEEVLPGVRWRRHVLWRHSLVWTKPER